MIGTGVATVFSGTAPGGNGGTAATGSWPKPGLAAVTNYFDAAHLADELRAGTDVDHSGARGHAHQPGRGGAGS